MTDKPTIPANVKPGIYEGIPNEAYHAGPGISKSGLWTISTKTPAHFKFPPEKVETTQSKAIKDMGTACHLAILEPEDFEKLVVRGPKDRRSNKWTDREEACKLDGRLLLVQKDFDNVIAMRDAIHANAFINGIITGGKRMVEASAYFIDDVTGELCRVRPDLWREDIGVMLDVKSTRSASSDEFARSVSGYGYHAQEAFYSDGWSALGKNVNGFLFMAFEKESPFAFKVYELPPSIVEEGRIAMRKALDAYHTCRETNSWPAYGEEVEELSFKRWQYRHTEAPAEEFEAA